ncbi:MAG: hypothetical protein K5656_02020 [Lachnospiraceae bacterium]|nr:hypothetical protein [Lachnospiraceae bacterium]
MMKLKRTGAFVLAFVLVFTFSFNSLPKAAYAVDGNANLTATADSTTAVSEQDVTTAIDATTAATATEGSDSGYTYDEDGYLVVPQTETADKKLYSGVFPTFNGKRASAVKFKITATEDAIFSLHNYINESEEEYGLDYSYLTLYSDKDVARSMLYGSTVALEPYEFSFSESQNTDFVRNFIPKGTTYYLVMTGLAGAKYSININLRKYVHAKTSVTVKEGDLKKAFAKNKNLHITCKITNDSDTFFKNNSSWYANGEYGDLKVSEDQMTATFTYNTGSAAAVKNIEVPLSGLDQSIKIKVVVGVSAKGTPIHTGPDYISFDGFVPADYELSFNTKISVYLKTGNKFKKKFTVDGGSTKTKKITGLKPNTKYKVKYVYAKTISDGNVVKSSAVVTVKTGLNIKPVIKSVKISNVKTHTKWNPGHYVGSVWMPGNSVTYTTYTINVTLKSKLKGCKGLYWQGETSKGTGTSFKFASNSSGSSVNLSKISVCGYTNESTLGLTKYSASKAVS